MYNFYSIIPHASDIYGVEVTEDAAENIGMTAWRKIGVKPSELHRDRFLIEDYKVVLPCIPEGLIIESVTFDREDRHVADESISLGAYEQNIEDFVSRRLRGDRDYAYTDGELAKLKQIGNELHFTVTGIYVTVAYWGAIMDEDGLPYLTAKQVDAIACYIAYIDTFKKARMGKQEGQMLQYMEKEWKRLMAAAKVPVYISQNEMDRILDAMTSWDRKAYGKTWKPIK